MCRAIFTTAYHFQILLMQASSNRLRLYPVKHVWEADQTTVKKVDLSQPIAFAAAFASPRGPGIACLSPSGVLHVSQSQALSVLVRLAMCCAWI